MELLNLKEKISFLPDVPKKELLFDSEKMRVVLFNLEKGQEIPAHTSESEVLMFLVKGQGRFLVGDKWEDVEEGAFVVCGGNEPHGMEATERMTVLAVIAPRPE